MAHLIDFPTFRHQTPPPRVAWAISRHLFVPAPYRACTLPPPPPPPSTPWQFALSWVIKTSNQISCKLSCNSRVSLIPQRTLPTPQDRPDPSEPPDTRLSLNKRRITRSRVKWDIDIQILQKGDIKWSWMRNEIKSNKTNSATALWWWRRRGSKTVHRLNWVVTDLCDGNVVAAVK